MERAEFLKEMLSLGSAFDKDLGKKGGVVEEYFKALGELTIRQVQVLFNRMKADEERFPTISKLTTTAKQWGWIKTPIRTEKHEGPEPMMSVVCQCEERFAINRAQLHGGVMFKCPNPECPVSYDAELIQRVEIWGGQAVFGGPYYKLAQDELRKRGAI